MRVVGSGGGKSGMVRHRHPRREPTRAATESQGKVPGQSCVPLRLSQKSSEEREVNRRSQGEKPRVDGDD